MTAYLNRCEFIGNLGKDAELDYTQSGQARLRGSLAVNYRTKDGGDETEWINWTWYGERAEGIAQYLRKGDAIYLAGRQKTYEWAGDDGVKHRATGIVVTEVQMLGSPPERGDAERPAGNPRPQGGPQGGGGRPWYPAGPRGSTAPRAPTPSRSPGYGRNGGGNAP